MKHTKTWRGRVFIGVSLDGFIARPDGDITWLTDPPEGRTHAHLESSKRAESWQSFFPTVDHVVMGRGTYEKVASFDEWPYIGKTVMVLSTTLPDQDDRVVVARTVDAVLKSLDLHDARAVYIDGGRVIQTFLQAGLVDEITISHAPVLIGSGLRLFCELKEDVHLSLMASHTTDDGMVHTTYCVDHRS